MPLTSRGQEGERYWTEYEVIAPLALPVVIVQNSGPDWFIYVSESTERGILITVGHSCQRELAESYVANIARALEYFLTGASETGTEPKDATDEAG